jgi:hypothetical protein
VGHAARLVIAIVLAMGIGLGVPLLWVWIGSKLQGGGADTVESTTAALIFAGIVITYVAIMFIAGWVQARTAATENRPPPRQPWNRSMRDEPYRPGERRLSPIESAFVFTAVVVTGAFMFWFFVFAGSPLPNQ